MTRQTHSPLTRYCMNARILFGDYLPYFAIRSAFELGVDVKEARSWWAAIVAADMPIR